MKVTDRREAQLPGGWTRRRFVRSVLVAMLAGASGACRPPEEGRDAGQRATPPWLSSVITAPESAARLGRSYLELHPEEANEKRLLADIGAALAAENTALSMDTSADQITAALQRVLRAEYTWDQVMTVSGWVLSRTEARLYALVSLNAETFSRAGA